MWGVSGRAACQSLLLWINLPGPHHPVMGTGPFNPSHSKYAPCQSRGGECGQGRLVFLLWHPLHWLGGTFGCASGWGWQPVPISPWPPGRLLVLPLACSSTALWGRLALPVLLTGEEKSGVCLRRSLLLPPCLTPQVAVFHRNVRLSSPLPHSSWFFSPLILAFISNYFFLSFLSLQRP